ncbi:MAG: glycosyltransferase family 2 protein [Immundisolibacteraceae bacterium]|nr:glycosyltransferase family 2 protein [Immundisolibacteraceae bacterium]
MNSISIIIVSWNTQELTLKCLQSIYTSFNKTEAIIIEIIVVDNNSHDGTENAIKKEFSKVHLIESKINLGFGRANNLGIAKASNELLFFLNSDTVLQANTLQLIFDKFNQPNYPGILGRKLIEPDGSIQKSVRGYPNFQAFLYSDTIFRLLPNLKKYYSAYRQKEFDFSKEKSVETVMGAAMLIPKKIIDQVGGFDPRFFMYFEEVDLCHRIRDAGFPVLYTPEIVVTHIGGASSSQARSKMHLIYRQSMFSYFRKHHGKLKTTFFSIAFKPLFLVQTVTTVVIYGVKSIITKFLLLDEARTKKYTKRYKVKMNFLTHDLFSFLKS